MKQYSIINTERAKGFTLIELLVVIAIIGVLAAVVLLAINPAELLRKSRDSTRFSDLANIRKAIDATLADNPTAAWIDAATATCDPLALCASSTTAANRSTAGVTGYVPMNIARYLSTLPIDPRDGVATTRANDATTGRVAVTTANMHYYFYYSNTAETYEIGAYVESNENYNRALNDGGNQDFVFEVGTNVNLHNSVPVGT